MTAVQSGTRNSWNQGRIVGPKPPLKLRHIWAIRTRLQHDGRVRDLAMFNTAIDSKLGGCDLVLLLGHTKLESTVRYLGIEVDDALVLSEQTDL